MNPLKPIQSFFSSGRAPETKKAPLSQILGSKTGETIALAQKEKVDMELPAGVDFSALWEEPTDPSSMTTILSGVAAAASVIGLIIVLFKH